MKKNITIGLVIMSVLLLGKPAVPNDLEVKLTSTLSSVSTTDQGKEIKIIRIQDTGHRLTDDFIKTSRECPPYCIQPTKINKQILNVGEIELFKFIKEEVNTNKGILVDTRLKSWFELESIPSAINIPYTSIKNFSKENIEKLLRSLGKKQLTNGTEDFSSAKKLLIFDNGVWCSQAKHFLGALLKYNYPTSKILYYREGLQGWKLTGLTTVVHKVEVVK